MTSMSCKPIDAFLNEQVQWTETGNTSAADELPYATHSGVFHFGDIAIRCYRLNDGRAIFDAEDFRKAFGGLISGLEN